MQQLRQLTMKNMYRHNIRRDEESNSEDSEEGKDDSDEDDEEENEAGNTDTDKEKLKKITKRALRSKAQDRTDMYRAFDGSALMAIGATRFLYSLVKVILKNLRYRYGTARTCVTDDEQRPARRLGGANVET